MDTLNILYNWCLKNNKNLIKQWDYEKNNSIGLDISKVTIGSNKKAWWICNKGHKWTNQIYKIVKSNQPCPICNGKRLARGVNDLATTNSDLLKDWNYKKNIINPTDITRISVKRVFWKCHKCGHEWSISVSDRAVDGHGCPKCALKIRGEAKHNTSLKTNGYLKDRKILIDWDNDANYPKTPKDYTPLSNKYAYWKCHKCGYKWKAKVNNRVKGRGCPVCSNKVVVKGINDLATTHPEIAKEWHPTKNEGLTPDKVSYGCGKKIYWLCPIGHEYIATVNHRTSGNGTKCPVCNIGRQTSFAEQAIYYYLKKEFPDSINKYKPKFLNRMEFDIYIPSRKTAIEYDGAAWHKNKKFTREKRKYNLCKENGIMLIRVMEKMPPMGSDIADRIINCGGEKMYEHKYLNELILDLLFHLTFKFRTNFDINVSRDERSILKYSREIDNENNFEKKFPKIAKEWHPTKNGILKSNMFKPYSDHRVWWLCPICGHEYLSTIGHRSYGTACPECGKKKSNIKRRKPVEMIDPKTNKTIRTFSSIYEASNELKINISNISTICQGKGNRKIAGGYKWRYKSN